MDRGAWWLTATKQASTNLGVLDGNKQEGILFEDPRTWTNEGNKLFPIVFTVWGLCSFKMRMISCSRMNTFLLFASLI